MLSVMLEGNDYKYEISELLKLFVDINLIQFIDNEALANDQSFLLICNITDTKKFINISTKLIENNTVQFEKSFKYIPDQKNNLIENRKISKRLMKHCVYEVMAQYYNTWPQWGILTGIRPTKIVHSLMDDEFNESQIKGILMKDYRLREDKIDLLVGIAQVQRNFICLNNKNSVALYISIPFCPTRCIYCSFPSNTVHKDRNIITDYLKALSYEIQEIGKLLLKHGKSIESLYIGGGTPTSLSKAELEFLLHEIRNHMDLSRIKEITVEAGRPDTITQEKLKVLKEQGVHRISINPQTMNSETLKAIGRAHTPQDIKEAFWLARKIGFESINMDIIVGLPNETPNMLINTLEDIAQLDPESLTVHTLAIKRSSKMKENIRQYELIKEEQAQKMLELAQEYSKKMGMIPYYMYRQKYMVGNLENVGYCKSGYECIYNIQIMEEKQSIIALGAGAISKIYYPKEDRLERIPNVTNIEHYIKRVDEMIKRKELELEKSEQKHIDI